MAAHPRAASVDPRRGFVAALARHPVAATMSLVALGAAAIVLYMYRASNAMIQEDARRSAETIAISLEEVRTLYTRDVVQPLRAHGVTITHDVRDGELAVPLPATFAMRVAEAIARHPAGARTSLYSPYPFPWREQERGPLLGFRQDAWNALREQPEQEFWRVEDIDGEAHLRYAVADRMREPCVDCHNSHPSSPRRGWAVGDVRGVLEVTLPLHQAQRAVHASVLVMGALAGGLLLVAASGLWLGLRGAQRATDAARRAAEATADINCELLRQIDERAHVEQALRRSQDRIRAVVRDSPAVIVSIDANGRILEMNHGAERMFAWSVADAVGQPFRTLLAPGFGALLDEALGRSETTVGEVVGEPLIEAIGVRKDGVEFPLEMSLLRWQADGELPKFTAVIGDLSQRHRLQEEIARTTLDERRRIGWELHDSLGQILVAIAFRARALEATLAEQPNRSAADAHALARMAHDATKQCERLSRGLAAAEADSEDLSRTLRKLAEWTSAFTRIDCTFSLVGVELPVPLHEAPHVRAIAQEAVTNAVKHAGAHRIELELEHRPPLIVLTVHDDGCGIADERSRGDGLGLKLMARRAALVGGSLTISRPTGRPGTTISLSLHRRRTIGTETPEQTVAGGSDRDLGAPRD